MEAIIRPLAITDRERIGDCLNRFQPEYSEFTFTNLYIWRRTRNIHLMDTGDACLFFVHPAAGEDRVVLFGSPLGIMHADEIVDRCRERIVGAVRLPRQQAEQFGSLGWDVYEDRDNADYLYSVDNLATLRGRRYSKKRNHVKNCLEQYNCSYETIVTEQIPECVDLIDRWCAVKGCGESVGLTNESVALKEIFADYSTFNCTGGVVRIDGTVMALAIAERLNRDTAVWHFEKAMPDIKGLSQLMTHWFSKFGLAGYQWVNREQDLGIPGLRQAKLSYYPDEIRLKYSAYPAGTDPRNMKECLTGICF